MARGGPRQGIPGRTYGNRTDLNANRMPVASAPAVLHGPASVASPPAPARPGPAPGSFGDFARPTEFPDEPLTAGAPSGPGPGPEVLGPPAILADDPVVSELRAIYQAHPTEELRMLLEDLDA